jgi:uncharacterized protein YciI
MLMLTILPGATVMSAQETRPARTTYYVAVVTKGPNWTAERTPELYRVSQEHRAWLLKMGSEGKALLFGPFTDNGEIRGLYVFKVASAEEARRLCEIAPAVKFGQVQVEIHPWNVQQIPANLSSGAP